VPIHRLSDSRLIRRSQQGDRDAFVALVQRYDDRLRGLVYGLVAGRDAMDRVLRVAYLKAWRDVVRADPDDDVGTWLYRTVYNACIDELRRERRRIEAPGSSGSSGTGSSGSGSSPSADDPVVAALASLSPEERVVAVLIDREGFTPEGAARILGLDPDTLTTRLASARSRLAAAVPARRARPRPRPDGSPRPTRPSPPTGTNGSEDHPTTAASKRSRSGPSGSARSAPSARTDGSQDEPTDRSDGTNPSSSDRPTPMPDVSAGAGPVTPPAGAPGPKPPSPGSLPR
jgi:RNA polymerase sigma-70 factor, ECF subfamily